VRAAIDATVATAILLWSFPLSRPKAVERQGRIFAKTHQISATPRLIDSARLCFFVGMIQSADPTRCFGNSQVIGDKVHQAATDEINRYEIVRFFAASRSPAGHKVP
jgi:hypothetical protein